MKNRFAHCLLAVAAFAGIVAVPAYAEHRVQNTRESSASTITSFLTGCQDDYSFTAFNNQIVAADLDQRIDENFDNLQLRVLDSFNNVVCWGSGGGDDDLMVACALPPGQYKIRVTEEFGFCPSPGDWSYQYILNVSIRNKASDGPVLNAIATSKNILTP